MSKFETGKTQIIALWYGYICITYKNHFLSVLRIQVPEIKVPAICIITPALSYHNFYIINTHILQFLLETFLLWLLAVLKTVELSDNALN